MKIGIWNVTASKNDYRIDILTEEFRRLELDSLGVSETHIPGSQDNKHEICSVRKDGVHEHCVGLVMNKEAAKSCLGWESINNRILIADCTTKKSSVLVMGVYAPVEPTDGDTSYSDGFYLQ
ncbi:uncharacterized protein LOC136037317 [Artemia franciscana]|uniref:uncharacterized protein LOC136037317 n=1 Tax=Artemia franciscana TaxID=6661 RepID=UPI0032DB769D